MEKGKKGEEIVFEWLKNNPYAHQIIDTREFRFSQRLDVDCGIEDMHGRIILAEIKTDSWLGKSRKVLFELFRINHFVAPYHYLGWGWRSPAEKLLYYAPSVQQIYSFDFLSLRKRIGELMFKTAKEELRQWLSVVPTDEQKTTFNLLVPENLLHETYKKFSL